MSLFAIFIRKCTGAASSFGGGFPPKVPGNLLRSGSSRLGDALVCSFIVWLFRNANYILAAPKHHYCDFVERNGKVPSITMTQSDKTCPFYPFGLYSAHSPPTLHPLSAHSLRPLSAYSLPTLSAYSLPILHLLSAHSPSYLHLLSVLSPTTHHLLSPTHCSSAPQPACPLLPSFSRVTCSFTRPRFLARSRASRTLVPLFRTKEPFFLRNGHRIRYLQKNRLLPQIYITIADRVSVEVGKEANLRK